MNKIVVTTQAEFDELPGSFKEYTSIYIESSADIWLTVNRQFENSHVEARGSSHVVAGGNSHVVAWGSSHVVARESSHVEAWANVSVKVHNSGVALDKLKQFATAICIGCDIKPVEKDDTATVLVTPPATYTKDVFLEMYRANKNGKGIYLYKVVQDDYTDHYTGEIKYEISTTVKPDVWDSDENRQCGDGLHLSPTPDLALTYHTGRILKCLVKIADFVVYPHDITKVRCREVLVVEEIKG